MRLLIFSSRKSRTGYLTAKILMYYFGHLRKMELRVFYFNRLCSPIAYSMKLICLSVCIVGVFFCIKLYGNHPFIAVSSGCVGGMSWYCYTMVYNRGFKLPCMVQVCQSELLQQSRMLSKRNRMVVMRQVRSLGRVEVSMGGFHELERSSTILFLDFALTKISTLIITFPGQLWKDVYCRYTVTMAMGGFNALERSSTIMFFTNVLANICTLIITFSGQLQTVQ